MDSPSPEAAATLGYVFHAAGNVEQARALLKIATMLRPDIWRHWFRQAVVCWGDEWLEAVAQTLSLKKDFAPAYFVRAMVFIARQVFDVAEDYAAQGAALQSADAGLRSEFPAFGLHWLCGLLLLRTGEVKRALASFDREINEGRREHIYFREYRVNALLGTGYAHLAAGHAAPAADAFRGALEFLPGSARALLGLGQALAQRGLEKEAEATAKRLQSSLVALTKGGRLMEVALVSAAVDAARDNHKAAAVTLQKLLEQAPPGQTGWMISIDPALQPLRDHAAFARVCALLSSRAS